MLGPLLEAFPLSALTLLMILGLTVSAIALLYIPFVQQFLFPFHDEFAHILARWRIGDPEAPIVVEAELERRKVEASALQAIASKQVNNSLLVVGLSAVFAGLFSFIWFMLSIE